VPERTVHAEARTFRRAFERNAHAAMNAFAVLILR
jgi:hypothetical protein